MTLRNDEGHLLLDGADLVDLAEQFGTPLYVYGAESIRTAYRELCQALPPEFHIHFSVKANPSLAVCRLLREEGARAEIASAGELAVALAAGWSADEILFAGPGKSDAELRAAIEAGIGRVHAESLGEVQRLAKIAAEAERIQPVCLRVNPANSTSSEAKIVTGGGPQKFGIDADQCGAVIEAVRAAEFLRFDGFHFFSGSQFHDHEALLEALDNHMATARALCEANGVQPRALDLGGGIGVRHQPDAERFDLEALGAGLAKRYETWRKEPAFAQTEFLLEPGRVLVSAAGVYLARVLDVKRSADQTYSIVDGGIHQALLPITSNGYRAVLANVPEQEGEELVYLGGPLCTSADQWHSGVALPRAQVGDLVAVMNSGAYGLSASMTLFLSHGIPAEVMVDGGRAHLIRTRSTPEDLLRDQKPVGTRIITTVAAMQQWSKEQRAAGRKVGYVPTLGCLHEGHATLIRAAAAECDAIAVSAFVNPLQFRPAKFAAYPRDLQSDVALSAREGAEVVFAPEWSEIYPEVTEASLFLGQELSETERPQSEFTALSPWGESGPRFLRTPGALACRMDGAHHPWHFDGVCTVVARLFEAVQPDRAYFGEKDPQQVAILTALNEWLDGDVQLQLVPTFRDPDGLAASSRNTQLSPSQRERACAVASVFRAGAEELQARGGSFAGVRSQWEAKFANLEAEIDYCDILDPFSLDPIDAPPPSGEILLYLAYFIDGLRLTDTWRLKP